MPLSRIAFRLTASTSLCAGLLVPLALIHAAPGQSASGQSISVAGIEVRAGGKGTVQVIVDGATLSNESRLYCISPDWTRRYYGFEDDKDLIPSVRTETTSAGAQRLILTLNGQGSGFHGTLTYEARPDRSLHIALDARIPVETTASVENRILTIPAAWLTGREITVQPADKSGPGLTQKKTTRDTVTGRAPLVAISDEVAGATLARGFSSLTLDTRLGPITVETSGTLPLSLVDYRRNKWAQGALYYWFGVLDFRLQADGTGQYSLTLRFPPPGKESTSQAAAVNSIKSNPRVLAQDTPPDRILPTPKSIQWLDGLLPLPPATLITYGTEGTVPTTATVAERLAAEGISDLLRESTGRQYRIVPEGELSATAPARIHIRLTELPDLPRVSSDRYRITFGHERIVSIEAPTTGGLRAAGFSLLQLLREGPALRRANVDDGATLPFRGIHFFTGRNAGKLQQRFLSKILGPLKINQLVWQVDYLQWDAFPAIHHKSYGMAKDDARIVRDTARRLGISIIPLLNTFGHSEWLLDNDALRHLADNPDNPYAYDPSNPQTIPTVEKIYAEALEFFQPTDFHIGHDEITNEDFPRREANRQVGVRKLILDSIHHWHGYLARRGIRTHLWGDMFIHASEASDAGFADSLEDARERRASLPPGVVIHDWHYGPDPVEKFTSLRVLNDAGLDTVAATWYDGRNIGRFATAATREAYRTDGRTSATGSTLGHLQTTWAGNSFDENSLENNPDQYAAYVLAAEASWNGGFDDPKELPYDYRAEFSRLWNADLLPRHSAAGWTADLNPAANFDAVPRTRNDAWLGAPGSHGFNGLPTGEQRFGRWLFHIPGTAKQPKAVHFRSLFHDGPGTTRLSIPLQRLTQTIQFAVAATFPGPQGEQIAHSIVHYVDGTSVTIPWKLGLTVFALDDDRETYQAPILWRRTGKADEAPRCIHGFIWINNRPESPIRTIETISDNKASGLLLFGISGIDAPKPRPQRQQQPEQ
jgi:hypothetical protein